MRRLALLCAIAAAGTVSVPSALAQTTTQGAIVGTVFDATDAIIPNATIVIRNNGTNAQQTLTSDGSGFFKAPQLAPGTYTVTISAPGFQELRSNNVIVQVNTATEFTQHLTTGTDTVTVDVTSAPPVLNFESPVYGGHLDNVEIENIPINNRRWSALAVLTPGVTPDANGFGLLSFRAISPLLNNVEIDGADDNQAFFSEERGRTRAGYSTSQAAVREFQVNTGVYSAEYGRAVGGVVNSVTKSGTNGLHGELYFYNRNSSRSAFQPFATNTTFNSSTNSYITAPYKPKDNRNQYGFGVGGPLIKDKLFWFYAFDQFKRNFPGTAKASNPTSFFTSPTALATGQTCNLATGAIVRANGAAAPSTLNSQTCLLAARLNLVAPTTYTSAVTQYNQQLQSLLGDLGSVPRFGDQTINTPKIDWQATSKQHVSALYHRLRWDSPGGVQTQATNTYAIDSFGTDFVKLDYGLVKLDSEFTPHLVNELRYQYGRELNDEGRQTPSAYTQNNFLNSTGVPTYVSIYPTSGFNAGTPYYSFRTAYPDERKWQIGDTATLQRGNHSIKFGEDFVHNYDVQNNLYQGNGAFSYTTSIANYFADLISKTRTCNATGSGVGTAQGGFYSCYNSFSQGFGPAIFQLTTSDIGVFAQDDWKVTPRLTLNLGVRYDYEVLPTTFAKSLNLATLPQTLNQPSDGNNVAPRVGFAWDPFGLGKTVVRGGYGIFYGRIFNSLLLNTFYSTGSANTQNSYSYTPTTAVTANGVSTIVAPTFPNVALAPPPATAQGPALQYLAPNLQNPYAQQFDLAVQQDIGANTVVSVSYIGALSRELPNFINTNLTNDSAHTYNFTYNVGAGANGSCGPLACGTTITQKIYSNRTQNGATPSSYAFNTPNPLFGATSEVLSNINASYNALTAEVQRRASKFISFDMNYTWAHALDFNQSSATSAGTNNWFDPFANARANYGNSNNNVPQRVVAWALINSPRLEGHSSLNYLVNGWSLKPLLQFQSGLPYSVAISGTVPNQCYVSGCLEANSTGLAGTGVAGYIPQLGRNSLRYPSTVNLDARVEKDFNILEKYNLQLIGEAFNLPNHMNVTTINNGGYILNTVQPTNPGTTANPIAPTSTLNFQSATFGTITAANSNNAYQVRQIQLAARFVF